MSFENENITNVQAEDGLLCGFKIGDDYYAIPVLEIQEVIKPQAKTVVPLSPDYIDGLINLRGQVVTSINMRKVLNIKDSKKSVNEESVENEEVIADVDYMNIIVKSDDSLYALVVDEVLDVMKIDTSTFTKAPDTLSGHVRNYINGVFHREYL